MTFPKLDTICDNCQYRGCGEEWRIVYHFETRCHRYSEKYDAAREKTVNEKDLEIAFKNHFSFLTKTQQRQLLSDLNAIHKQTVE